jgi:hypothetical protein
MILIYLVENTPILESRIIILFLTLKCPVCISLRDSGHVVFPKRLLVILLKTHNDRCGKQQLV